MSVVRIIKWADAEVKATATRAAAAALFKAGEFVVADSRRRCPKDTGELRGSAMSAPASARGGDPIVIVSYNTPYARKQHEDLSLRHRVGGPKYLENAVKENEGKIKQYVGLEIGKAFK